MNRWWDLRTLEMTHELSLRDQPITSMEKSHDGDSLALTAGKEVVFVSLETYVRRISRLP